MNYFREYKLVWIPVILFITISTSVYFVNPPFAGSNLYTAIATFIVGCFALLIFTQEKIDQKRDAATVILAEIRYAERLIEKFKDSGISPTIIYSLLPSNHWGKYNYLFVKDLDQDEVEEINNFYNQCFILDHAINQIGIFRELVNKSQAFHKTLSLIAKESAGDPAIFKHNKLNYMKLIKPDEEVFQGDAVIVSIDKTLKSIRPITTSTTGLKLKNISR